MAGPGFINFYLSNLWMGDIVRDVLAAGAEYGRADLGKGRKAQIEFVSANPTGPLHVGHGRGAAVGDVTANILKFAGWNVEKEYYVNDNGLQMNILGRSTQSRYFKLLGHEDKCPFPEESYKGDYIFDIAREVIEKHGEEFLDQPLEESLPFFDVGGGPLRRLNLNKLSLNQLRNHPYINFYQAKAITEYRRLKGPLHSLTDLSLLPEFPARELERLTPYVEF